MPKQMHENLKKQARKKFGTTKSKRAKRYIYSTLQEYENKKKSKK